MAAVRTNGLAKRFDGADAIEEPALEDRFAALTTDATDEDGGIRTPVESEP